MSMYSGGYFTIVVGFLAIAMLATSWPTAEADEVPAFFLKIAKNIPRVGRSDRYEDYFMKSARNAPRIGRREGLPGETMSTDVERFGSPGKRMINIPLSEDRAWSHFPLAIEGPPELWRTLAGYTGEHPSFGSDEVQSMRKLLINPWETAASMGAYSEDIKKHKLWHVPNISSIIQHWRHWKPILAGLPSPSKS